MTDDNKYISKQEVADLLGISHTAIWKREQNSNFPPRHKKPAYFGPEVWYLREDIEAFKNHTYKVEGK